VATHHRSGQSSFFYSTSAAQPQSAIFAAPVSGSDERRRRRLILLWCPLHCRVRLNGGGDAGLRRMRRSLQERRLSALAVTAENNLKKAFMSA
jgi:hypothetical protein